VTLAVVTPTYRNDWPLFVDLHQSVLRYTEASVRHYAIVPEADVPLFSQLAGPRCVVMAEESLYPRHYYSARIVNRGLHLLPGIPSSARVAAVNAWRPWNPVRGWVMQQVLKMEACCRVDADLLLLIDSDIVLVRPIASASLGKPGHARFYRRPGAVDAHLPQHVQWHEASRKLLGLPPPQLPVSDYVSSLSVWDPGVLRALLARIEQTTGRSWVDAVTALPTFSEWTLYGVFVDELMPDAAGTATDASLCHSYWDPIPLTQEDANRFVAAIGPDDLAVLIQSKSRTPLEIRRSALATLDARST
jgi:hypothetical protein